MEVLERVSSILKFYKFCPTTREVVISTETLDLSRYKCPLPSGVIPNELGNTVAVDSKEDTNDDLCVLERQ